MFRKPQAAQDFKRARATSSFGLVVLKTNTQTIRLPKDVNMFRGSQIHLLLLFSDLAQALLFAAPFLQMTRIQKRMKNLKKHANNSGMENSRFGPRPKAVRILTRPPAPSSVITMPGRSPRWHSNLSRRLRWFWASRMASGFPGFVVGLRLVWFVA